MAALLDVNALIALVDEAHTGHFIIHKWFAQKSAKGWASCPLVENGMVRVLSQPSYCGVRRSPAAIITLLRDLRSSAHHEFWHNDVSLSDDTLFNPAYIVGPSRVADAYLLGLAKHRGGKVVSFDRSMPWQAIRGGSPDLIELP